MQIRHLTAACALLAATPCLAAVRWVGDFESGNLNQWTKRQEVSTDRLAIVTDPVRQGRYALKVTVKQGDDPINASGNRAELVQVGGTEEGTEAYYRWSTMFAPDYPSAKAWQLFAQWHHPENYGSPPLQFCVYGEELSLTLGAAQTEVWRAPLKRGVWHDFVLHVRFSDDPKVGFIELWYDGEHVLPKTYGATRANGYLKFGLYRSEAIQQDGVLYQDAMVRGEKLEDVMPAQASAQTPAPGPGPGPSNPGPSPTPPAQDTTPVSSSVAPQIVSSDTSGGASAGGCSATSSGPTLGLGLAAAAVLIRARSRRRLRQ